jgi:hypothetical protein
MLLGEANLSTIIHVCLDRALGDVELGGDHFVSAVALLDPRLKLPL